MCGQIGGFFLRNIRNMDVSYAPVPGSKRGLIRTERAIWPLHLWSLAFRSWTAVSREFLCLCGGLWTIFICRWVSHSSVVQRNGAFFWWWPDDSSKSCSWKCDGKRAHTICCSQSGISFKHQTGWILRSPVSLQHEINSSVTFKPAAQSFVFQEVTQADVVEPVTGPGVFVCWGIGLFKLQYTVVQVFPRQCGLRKDGR